MRHSSEIAGDRFNITAGDGGLLYAGTFSVDPSAQPARIDFAHDGGQASGQVWEGIYRLEDGTLTIVDDAPDPGKGRPTEFAAPPGSGWVMLVFER